MKKIRTVFVMGLSFVKRSEMPVAQKGKSSGPSVSVTENGQVAFNAAASEGLGGRAITKVAIAHDSETGQFGVYPKGHKSVAKLTDADMFDIRWNKEKNKKGQKQSLSGTVSSMSGLLKANGYDYKASGQQSFAVTIGKDNVLSFTLPKGKLTPKPKNPRKPKVAPAAPAAPESGNGPVIPPTSGSDELVLDVA
jgi:hypothetical protein